MKVQLILFFVFLSLINCHCYRMRKSNGGGRIENIPVRSVNANDIGLHPGYKIEPVSSGLTFPSGVAFDDNNKLYVLEAGYSYGEVWEEPRLLRVDEGGTTTLIGKGTKNGPWTTVAYQTQLLDVHTTDRVLEIGTGSAYQAAILASIANEVFSIERQKKLFERNIHFRYLRDFDNLYLFYGDGFDGLPQFAPFDRILITAAAPYVPENLMAQLKWNGKMVLPLGKEKPQQMTLITKLANDEVLEESFDMFSFVPMLKGKKE